VFLGDDDDDLKDGKDVVQAAVVEGVLAVNVEDDNKYPAAWLGLVSPLFSLAGGTAGGRVEMLSGWEPVRNLGDWLGGHPVLLTSVIDGVFSVQPAVRVVTPDFFLSILRLHPLGE
jgi:hypothetical protein